MKKEYSREGLPDLLQTPLKKETDAKPVDVAAPAVEEAPAVVEPATEVVENKEESKNNKKTK